MSNTVVFPFCKVTLTRKRGHVTTDAAALSHTGQEGHLTGEVHDVGAPRVLDMALQGHVQYQAGLRGVQGRTGGEGKGRGGGGWILELQSVWRMCSFY